jgi:hypothetical protein
MIQTLLLATAFYIGEVENGTSHRDCFYEYLGRRYTITISWYKMCPMNINI